MQVRIALRQDFLRDCSEHPLVDREEQVWDPRTANRGLGQNVLEPEVGKIADKLARSM